MSEHAGIEAAARVLARSEDWRCDKLDAEAIVDAFLAEQPEMWRCEEHKMECGEDYKGRISCPFPMYMAADFDAAYAACRIVRVRIVVLP